jgi:hypothetical protein
MTCLNDGEAIETDDQHKKSYNCTDDDGYG